MKLPSPPPYPLLPLRLAALATAVSFTASGARAALPVFAGPGDDDVTINGLTNIRQPWTERVVTNMGLAFANATLYANDESQGTRAITWGPGRPTTVLGTGTIAGGAANRSAQATAINHAGQVVGYQTQVVTGGVVYKPCVWPIGNATPYTLPSPTGGSSVYGFATGMNTNGTVVGRATVFTAGFTGERGTRWVGTFAQMLPTLAPDSAQDSYDNAEDINDSGVTVGSAQRYGAGDVLLGDRAVRWTASSAIVELEPISTRPDGFAKAFANHINAAGVAVGYSSRFTGSTFNGDRAARWAATGTGVIELPPPPGRATGSRYATAPVGITNNGVVAGNFADNEDYAAFGPSDLGVRWSASNLATALLPLTAHPITSGGRSHATSINNLGVIVGGSRPGEFETNESAAVMWLPNTDQAIDLNAYKPALSLGRGWSRFLEANGVSETGFVTGVGLYANGFGMAAAERAWTMLVPQAGTYGRGDANFDAGVNFDDLLLLAQHYGQPNPSLNVYVADVNLDGATNFDDLLALAQNYGSGAAMTAGLSPDFAAEWSLAQSLVPEPGALSSLAALTAGLRRRR